MGMRNWKKANVPAMPSILFLLIPGSCSPLAIETEKASIASPTPKIILSRMKFREICMYSPFRSVLSEVRTAGIPHFKAPSYMDFEVYTFSSVVRNAVMLVSTNLY